MRARKKGLLPNLLARLSQGVRLRGGTLRGQQPWATVVGANFGRILTLLKHQLQYISVRSRLLGLSVTALPVTANLELNPSSSTS
jgi:hypothetical protein